MADLLVKLLFLKPIILIYFCFFRGKTFRLNNTNQPKHNTKKVFKKRAAPKPKVPDSEEVTARKMRFNPDGVEKKGKTLKVGGRP